MQCPAKLVEHSSVSAVGRSEETRSGDEAGKGWQGNINSLFVKVDFHHSPYTLGFTSSQS